MKRSIDLACQHWDFIKDLMEGLANYWGVPKGDAGGNIAEFLYKKGFLQGYEYRKEDK